MDSVFEHSVFERLVFEPDCTVIWPSALNMVYSSHSSRFFVIFIVQKINVYSPDDLVKLLIFGFLYSVMFTGQIRIFFFGHFD